MDCEKRFELLANIMRASHFEWRRAALATNPQPDPEALIRRYWEEVGRDTAAFYLRKIDPAGDVARQVADLFVGSSVAMGEDAEYAGTDGDGCHLARHNACPWFDWHKREGLLAEDRLGCDHWLATVVDEVNRALGAKVRFQTVEALPDGGTQCLRRFWQE